jgi:hypothetical protein
MQQPPVPEPDCFAMDGKLTAIHARLDDVYWYIEAQLEHTAELVEKAVRPGVQIVCLPEDLATIANHACRRENLPLTRQVVSETAEGLVETFTRAAARSKIHVVGSAYLPEGDRFYNVAFLIDPNGDVIGRYRKTHLTRGEASFVAAGREYPVFGTELGRSPREDRIHEVQSLEGRTAAGYLRGACPIEANQWRWLSPPRRIRSVTAPRPSPDRADASHTASDVM